MDEVRMLWSFEDDIGEVGEEGVEGGFHIAH
jgi:hypothetical protein